MLDKQMAYYLEIRKFVEELCESVGRDHAPEFIKLALADYDRHKELEEYIRQLKTKQNHPSHVLSTGGETFKPFQFKKDSGVQYPLQGRDITTFRGGM